MNRRLICMMLGCAFALPAQQFPFPALPSTDNPALGAAALSSWAAMQGASANYRTKSEAKQRAEELKIQQGWLDLARQQAGQPGAVPVSAGAGDMKQALLMANMAHADFAALTPAMQIIAGSLQPDWAKINVSEYLECLYVIAKNASFAEGIRDKLLSEAAAAPPVPRKP